MHRQIQAPSASSRSGASRNAGVILILNGIWAVAGCAHQQAEPVTVERVTSEVIATVQAVNLDSREIVLRTSAGRDIPVVAGQDVRNLDQMRAGDKVKVVYYEGLMVELRDSKTPEQPLAVDTRTFRSEKGDTPAGGFKSKRTAMVTVTDVDKSFHTVSFSGQNGYRETVAVVDPKMQEFTSRLKPGDKIAITYLEALAVAVVPENQ